MELIKAPWSVKYRGRTLQASLSFAAAMTLAEDTIRANRKHRLNEAHGKCHAYVVSNSLPIFDTTASIYVELSLSDNQLLTTISIL